MEKKTSGAWIIHHTHKLQGVKLTTPDYDQIGFAGKCGIVLNALAGSSESDLTNERVNALAKATSKFGHPLEDTRNCWPTNRRLENGKLIFGKPSRHDILAKAHQDHAVPPLGNAEFLASK